MATRKTSVKGKPETPCGDSVGCQDSCAPTHCLVPTNCSHSFNNCKNNCTTTQVDDSAGVSEGSFDEMLELIRQFLGEMGKPGLPYIGRLRDLNNRFNNSEIYDHIESILKTYEKIHQPLEGYELLNEIVERSQAIKSDREKPKFLTDILVGVPKEAGYEPLTGRLEDLNHDFRREMAARIEPALNAYIQAMPHDTYDQKKDLTAWVNNELRRFNLAIKCPKTERPGILLADMGNHPEIGRFQIDITQEDGKHRRTVSSPELFHLYLMEASPRREWLLEKNQRIRSRGDGTGRG